jgi:hypothetical protein
MERTELTLNKEFHISHLKENSSNIWQVGATKIKISKGSLCKDMK